MIKHLLKISFRYLIRNKGITFINIVGLSLGVTFFILIGLYVKKELSFDKSFQYKDDIYRIEFAFNERGIRSVQTSALGPDLKDNIASIDEVLRVQFWDKIILKKNENYYDVPQLCLADSTFFDFFEQTWIYGNPKEALNKPYNVVLTEELSKRMFGDINPLGYTFTSQSGRSIYTVSGVIKKRIDSHITYDAVLSLITRGENNPGILNSYSSQQWLTYFKINKDTDPGILDDQIFQMVKELIPDLKSGEEEADFKILLNPLPKIYFSKDRGDFGILHGNLNLVRIFIAIAILIILIACINFINISTARSLKRAKEVGLRKIVGAKRSLLVKQFLIESFTVSIISTIIGLAIAEFFLPYFNNLVGKQMNLILFDPLTIVVLAIIIITSGFLAGIYPAFYISSYKAINAVKGEIYSGRRSLGFRRGLILFQFLISVLLINGSLLIYKQLKYTREKDLGFEKERILTIDVSSQILRNRDMVKDKLLQNTGLTNVSFSFTIPGSDLNYEGYEINNGEVNPLVFSIDPDYFDTYGIKIIDGRKFDWNIGSDSISNCIINETLAKQIGLENPVGQFLYHDNLNYSMFPVNQIKIIGVVKDFHFKSLRTTVEPLILAWNPDRFGYLNIKISEGQIASAMSKIKTVLEEFAPGMPMEYQFIDESFDNMYKSDERMSKILIYFTLLAILISILGLFGMVSYLTEQRTKEIAIRKTLGAKINSIIITFTREYTWLVIIANIIALPLVLWFGYKWLAEFAYQTPIGAGIFIIGAVVSISIAFITVFSITMNAANLNPAESLRYE